MQRVISIVHYSDCSNIKNLVHMICYFIHLNSRAEITVTLHDIRSRTGSNPPKTVTVLNATKRAEYAVGIESRRETTVIKRS